MRLWLVRTLAALVVLVLAGAFLLWAWGLRTPVYPQPSLTGKVEERRFDFGGLSRSFLVYVPERLTDPAPVVLVLHGAGSSPARMRSDTAWAFEELADRDGALVVYPGAWEGQWNDCRATGEFAARQRGLDDVGFLRAVVARLDGDPALNGRRVATGQVFATGLSNGGHMALRLALEAPDFVAGVAAIAASLPAPGNSLCQPSGRGVPVLLLDGDADPISPYGGGEIWSLGPFNRRGTVQSALATAEYFSGLAGFSEPPFEHRYPDTDPADGTVASRMVWSAGDRPEVDLITIHGGGHTIPHPVKTMPRILGPTSHDVPAAEEIWRFFRRQVLVGRDPD
ncbi:MAG: polyhydroxybutyrate depolymerase [Gammaproteobacteria bacterium]